MAHADVLDATSNADSKDMRVAYAVRYVGCVQVQVSMKVLDFKLRAMVARECIRRVCHANGCTQSPPPPPSSSSRKEAKEVNRIVGTPDTLYTGARVMLVVSTEQIRITKVEDGVIVSCHEMANISFASCGENELCDYVAFVAKQSDRSNPPRPQRYCFVMQCDQGVAQHVIADVGKAFAMRYENLAAPLPPAAAAVAPPSNPNAEYYNDMPEQQPPSEQAASRGVIAQRGLLAAATSDDNLIDLNSPAAKVVGVPSAFVFAEQSSNKPSPSNNNNNLGSHAWFFPNLGRHAAEVLVPNSGDFLIRCCESHGAAAAAAQPQQYVLTARGDDGVKHLLIVDDDGRIRTQDLLFDSVEHFVEHYHHGAIPIISSDMTIWLQSPAKSHDV